MGIKKKYSKRHKRFMWGFDCQIGDRRVRQYIYTTRKEAEAALLALHLVARNQRRGIAPPAARAKLTDLCTQRIATITEHGEKIRSKRVLQALIACLPAGIYIDEITTPHIRKWVDQRQADGVSPTSINRELNIIAATLHAASQFFPQLAQWLAPRMPRPKAPQRGRERLISRQECDDLLAHLMAPRQPDERYGKAEARHRVGQIFQWAMLTGMRHGEIDRLKWEHIDWDGGQIKVINRKNDSHRYLVLTPTLRMILEARRQITPRGKFIFTQGGNTNPSFYTIMRDACKACGIAYGQRTAGGLVLHDARHSYVTKLLQGGIDLSTIGAMTGHKDRHLLLYYSHPTVDSRIKAAAILDPEKDEKERAS